MKIFKYIFLLMLPLAALAQFTPPAADRVTVTTDGDGLLVGPSTFWTANAAALAAVVEGEDIDVDWAQITGTPTTLGGYGITDAVNVSAIGTTEGDLVTLSAGGVWADARISASSVTQHEGALTIANTQVTGLGDLAAMDDITLALVTDSGTAAAVNTGTTQNTIPLIGAGNVLSDSLLSDNIPRLSGYNEWDAYNEFTGASEFTNTAEVSSLMRFTMDGVLRLTASTEIGSVSITRAESYEDDGFPVDWNLRIPDEAHRGTANIATREWVESDATISEGQITGLGELATMDSVSNANLDFAVVPATEAVMLSDGGGGMGHEHVNGVYLRDGELNGKPRYVKGDQEIVWRQLDTDPIGWHVKDINDSIWYFWSTQDVATPDLVTNWLTGDSFPVATVSLLSYTPATQEWVDEKIDARFSSLNTAAVDASGVLAMPDLNTGNTVLVDEVADSGEEPTGNVVLSGAGESQVNGVYLPNGEVNGRPSWKLDGSGDPGMRLLATSGSLWVWQIIDPTHEVLYGTWDQEVENPWDAIGWQDEEGDLPAPTVEQETAPAPGDTLTSITGMVTGAQYMLVNATGAALTLEASANLVLARGDPDLTLAEDEAVIVISLSPTKATIP